MVRTTFDSLLSTALITEYNSEYAVNWYDQQVIFFGFAIADYYLYDYDGNLIDKIDHDAMLENYDEYQETYNAIECSNAKYVSFVSTYDDEVEINLDQDDNKIIEQIKSVITHYHEETLKVNHNLCHNYMSTLRKEHDWHNSIRPALFKLKKLINEYESACMEPDGNIMCDYVKQIDGLFKDIDDKYTEFWNK